MPVPLSFGRFGDVLLLAEQEHAAEGILALQQQERVQVTAQHAQQSGTHAGEKQAADTTHTRSETQSGVPCYQGAGGVGRVKAFAQGSRQGGCGHEPNRRFN